MPVVEVSLSVVCSVLLNEVAPADGVVVGDAEADVVPSALVVSWYVELKTFDEDGPDIVVGSTDIGLL